MDKRFHENQGQETEKAEEIRKIKNSDENGIRLNGIHSAEQGLIKGKGINEESI